MTTLKLRASLCETLSPVTIPQYGYELQWLLSPPLQKRHLQKKYYSQTYRQ